jgi:hypothetical protein
MKFFKSSQRFIIVFLTLFIVVCCFFIVRLEIKAANLQSRWDEHQKSLKNNEDVLDKLEWFSRSTKNYEANFELSGKVAHMGGGKNFIGIGPELIDGRSVSDIKFGGKNPYIDYFGYDSKSKSTFMRGVGNGNVLIRSNSGDDFLSIKDDWILLHSYDKNNSPLGLGIDPSLGKVEILNGGYSTNIILTKEDISIDGKNEIDIEGKIITMVDESGKCKIRMAEDDIQIICAPSKGPVFGVSFSPSTQSININTHDASINLTKEVIHFEAKGDINITSKNGNVNIKGKKVKVNE